MAKNKKELL